MAGVFLTLARTARIVVGSRQAGALRWDRLCYLFFYAQLPWVGSHILNSFTFAHPSLLRIRAFLPRLRPDPPQWSHTVPQIPIFQPRRSRINAVLTHVYLEYHRLRASWLPRVSSFTSLTVEPSIWNSAQLGSAKQNSKGSGVRLISPVFIGRIRYLDHMALPSLCNSPVKDLSLSFI